MLYENYFYLNRAVPGPEVIYLKHIERPKPHLPPADDDKTYPPPRFVVPLNYVQQLEGGRIHLEAKIEPVGDPTICVEWFVNGRVLEASKFTFICEFLYYARTYIFGMKRTK